MQIELLKDIVISFAGPNASGIVELLHNKKNVNEFLIAKKLNMTINQTRNILYRLADQGLVSFIRKKDSRKGGWYTYFWTLNSGKSLMKFKDKLVVEIENLRSQLSSRKMKTFYYCANCHIEYSEDNALAHDYTCPECGEVLEVRESGEVIKKLESEILKLEKLMGEVEIELSEVEKKEDRARGRRRAAEKKKKDAERERKKKERAKKAKKEGKVKKSSKKPKKKIKKTVKKVKKTVKKKAKKSVKKRA